jgi:hypothetical protein
MITAIAKRNRLSIPPTLPDIRLLTADPVDVDVESFTGFPHLPQNSLSPSSDAPQCLQNSGLDTVYELGT